MESLKEKLKNALESLYNEEVFPSLDVEKETAFVMQWGDKFPVAKNAGILFVGQAVNGWAKKEDQSFEKLFARKDQMKWVDERRHPKENPVMNKSSFWRVVKEISSKYYKVDDQWYSHVAWSNLYKISPNESNGRGNPSKYSKDKQLDLCRRILQTEIEILSPKYVILLTSGWERSGFLKKINDNQHTKPIDEQPFDKYKVKVYKIKDTYFFASVHPRSKDEKKHVNAIISLLSKY